MANKSRTDEDYATLLGKIKADFDERLARMAAEPTRWIEFIEHVATFGAQYSLTNQMLLLAQAEERGVEPRYFLPYGNKDGSTGWKAHQRWVRAGETAFKVWAPVKRRPTEEQAAQWEAAGRTVKRDQQGRPVVQVVGFRLANTFELSQTDGAPFEPPTVARQRRIYARARQSPQLLAGDDPTGAYDDLVTLIGNENYGYALVPPGSGYLGDANGVTVTRPGMRVVQVRDDVDPAQRTKTTMHELAHIRCGHTASAAPDESVHRGRKETEAESVTHIVLQALGLDSSGYSEAYVFGWADGDLNLVKECAETVLRISKQILLDLTPPGDTPDDAEPANIDTADSDRPPSTMP
jgi:hypothetical protein